MSAATQPAARRTWSTTDLRYPPHLPVTERRKEILAALRDHQVVVVAGETGSGKTTQLPKMLLETGRGQAGQIGHTQPRRIAARSVAERIAEELHTDLGDAVGYQVRFTDHSSPRTQVKVMTDGILLAELQRDRELRRYDAIVIDEAHERSLNIDFVLGYLRRLLPRRPDLQVVVTSATIDPQRFADHFTLDPARPVPVIEVSGRTFPVEVRYRPLVDPDRPDEPERDQVTGICEAVEELWTEARQGQDEDILVFLSGEREIRDAADALAGMGLPHTEILPLYARLSAAEQHRVFRRAPGRRVVLATNVAETSLTVPGIRYVVDTGTARISRYSQRTKVQRLPIEPVSQASALQRSGRCGRVSDGIAIRLYAEADFEGRPAFTEPEILRTSLASVILQMTSLGLGDIRRFSFVDAPDARQVADGVRLLEELGAVHPGERGGRSRLTASGRTLARMPVDPRLGRMVLEADRLGCTAEVLVLVAALSIQDPRERPADKQTQADQAHARFRAEHSDFATLLTLWDYLRERQKALSGSAFRRMCKAEYLHYLRVREWQDVHAQLKRTCKDVRIDASRRTTSREGEVDLDRVHQALLAGLLSHVGLRDEVRRDYQGARGGRFSISPGSTLFRRQPDYVMAAELVETSKVWARTNARIDPAWAEAAGAHVVKRSYSEPRWSRRKGAAVATERVTLYGVPLVADRTVQLGRIDPATARDLFVRHALVEGDWETRHAFWRRNDQLLRRLAGLEERARRRDLVVDDEVLRSFYDERVPAEVVSARHFDTWWKGASREQPHLLDLTEDLLTRDSADRVSASDYPRSWRQGDLELPLTYSFEPGRDDDGVTVHVPLEVLNRVQDSGFDWQVPGMREDLAVALVRGLPKSTRRSFVPVPDHARAALLAAGAPDGRSFTDALADGLHATTGMRVPPREWDVERVPAHLRMRFAVEDGRRRVVGAARDLTVLKDSLAGRVQDRISRAGADLERAGLTTWDLDELPVHWEGRVGRHTVQGFPALVDRGAGVDLRLVPDEAAATALTRQGVRRLLLLATAPPWKRVLAGLSNADKLALARNPHGSVPALLDDALAAAVDSIVAEFVGPVRTRGQFEEALAKVRAHVAARVLQVVAAVRPVLDEAAEVDRRLAALAAAPNPPAWLPTTLADVSAQRESLVRAGFVADTGLTRLPDVRRYLRAAGVRLDRAVGNAREPVLQEQVDQVETAYADLVEVLGPGSPEAASDPVRAIAWMVEELRVSLFAQSLGTAYPVSVKRVLAAVAAARP